MKATFCSVLSPAKMEFLIREHEELFRLRWREGDCEGERQKGPPRLYGGDPRMTALMQNIGSIVPLQLVKKERKKERYTKVACKLRIFVEISSFEEYV